MFCRLKGRFLTISILIVGSMKTNSIMTAFAYIMAIKSKECKKYGNTIVQYLGGFSEEVFCGDTNLDAKSSPSINALKLASAPSYKKNQCLSKIAFSDDGTVINDQGNIVTHCWEHREILHTRFLIGGHNSMPEYEILELLLFNAIQKNDVKPLAKSLLSTFGDLNSVVAASEYRLLKVEGATQMVYLQLRIMEAFAQRMGRAKILNREIANSWDDRILYCRTSMAHRETEQFRILFLDCKNVIIADEEQAEGTVDHVPVYPREVAKRALELNASAIIMVHNHPSGDPTPSQQDISMTESVSMACRSINVTIHDHVIIGKEREFSFKSEGLFDRS